METEDDETSTGWDEHFAHTEVCGLDSDESGPQHPQTQGCATERSGDLRSENGVHVGWTDRSQTCDGGKRHIPIC